MCSVDWTAIAAWIAALGTVALAVIGGVAARYAYKTAIAAIAAAGAANATLRLETEPVLMIAAEGQTSDPTRVVKVEILDRKIFARGGMPKDTASLYLTLRNIGRSPAVNLAFRFIVTVPQTDLESISFPIYIQSMLPQEPYVLGFCNKTGLMLSLDVERVTSESLASVGTPRDTLLARSAALPFPLMYTPVESA